MVEVDFGACQASLVGLASVVEVINEHTLAQLHLGNVVYSILLARVVES